MDRNVLRPRGSAPKALGGDGQPRSGEKLLKYFPAEALALYSTLDPLARETFSDDDVEVALWIALALAVVFCILYLREFWKIKLKRQVAISCAALVLYVAALGGPFAFIEGWKPGYGALAAVVASAFLIFLPAPEAPRPPPPAG